MGVIFLYKKMNVFDFVCSYVSADSVYMHQLNCMNAVFEVFIWMKI